jgi:DNA topoisomerase-1
MEELGIGRPSTYDATIQTLKAREYVRLDKKRLVPEDKGRLVTAFLESFFARYVGYDFTADLEEKLDRISAGELNWKDVLREFWTAFYAQINDTKELRVTNVLDALNEALAPLVFPTREDGSDPRICQVCGTGNLSLKLGKYGAFVGCSNYPDCSFTRQLSSDGGTDAESTGLSEPKALGKDPVTEEELTLRSGRFGPYIQRGEGKEAKRSSLPKGWKPEDIDYEKAMALIALPRDIGKHPESGKMISSGLGRYGPFLLHDGSYANLETIEDVFTVGLNRAVTVLAEKQSKGPSGRGTPAALKDLGDHPDGGGKITVRDGKYGPYVNWGKVNATLPKGKDPQSVSVEEALALIIEKAGKPSTGKAKAAPKSKAAAAPKAKTAAAATKATKTTAKPAAKAKAKPAAKKPAKKAAV